MVSAKRAPSAYALLKRLDWTAPRYPPHGLTGAVALTVGAILVINVLTTSVGIIYWPLFLIYLVAATGNAIAGYKLANRAPKFAQNPFRLVALFQSCLCFYCWRFSPLCPAYGLGPVVDVVFGIALVAGTLACMVMGFLLPVPFALGFASLVGGLGCALTAVYPVQLALGGATWWQCNQDAYPYQGLGMTVYIYVPVSWALAAIMFGVTLYLRKVVSATGFALGFVSLVVGTLIATVLIQEYHMPWISTQRLYLPCPAPPDGSWDAKMVHAFDVSALSQSVIRNIRNATGWELAPVYTL